MGPRDGPLDLSDGAAIDVGGWSYQCDKVSRIHVIVGIEDVYKVATHNSCTCNEFRSLADRHLIARRVGFQRDYYREAFNSVAKELTFTCCKTDLLSIVNNYSGPKRKVYYRAYENVMRGLRVDTWANISMFVKPDKYPEGQIAEKAPRAIQFRRPEFNLLVAQYLHPLERQAYDLVGDIGLPVIAKGKNNIERARLIVEAASMFSNPIFVLLDHSKFDSHVNTEHLKSLHEIYLGHYKSNFLRYLLSKQLRNKGWTKGGLRYKVEATRMSGDYDTGLGNSLLNYVVLRSWVSCKHYILLDGDDSVLIVEEEELTSLDFNHFSKMGFKTEHSVVKDLWEVEFCRAKLLPTEPPRFARDWRRALSNMTVTTKRYEDKTLPRLLAGIGLGELAVSNGVPVIGPIARKLSELSDRPILDEDIRFKYGNATTSLSIDDEVRVAYAIAWGCSPAMQLELEKNTPDMVGPYGNWFNCLPDVQED